MASVLDTSDDLLEFGDAPKTRAMIYDNMEQAVKARFPVEDDDHRLELADVRYDGPKEFSLSQQKAALMKGQDLVTPLRGKWRLIHKPSNNVVSERDDVVMRVPYYTDRGTFIRRANEYSVASQARLRPGVYVRKRRTGEVEAHVNVRPGTGRPFRLRMDDETGVFKAGVGTSETPAYALLKAAGATDDDLIKAWGPDLVAVNARAAKETDLAKLYERLGNPRKPGEEEERDKGAALRKRLSEYALDPDVVEANLGIRGAAGVDAGVLLRATGKILNVARGEEEADDRDHPRFAEIMGVESLLSERVSKDAGRLARNLLWKAKRKRSTDPIRRGALDLYTDAFVNGSGLVSPLDETNPLSTLEQMHRITKLGEGGISSAESVGDEARDVNPGFMGYIDPIAGPEGCYPGDAEVMTRKGWRKWRDLGASAEFMCVSRGTVTYAAADVERSEFDGDLIVHSEGSVVLRATPSHKHWCRAPLADPDGYFRWERASNTCAGARSFMLAADVDGDGPLPLDALGNWDRDAGFEAGTSSKADAESLERAAVRSGMSALVFGEGDRWRTLVSPRRETAACRPASEYYAGDVFCATVPGGMLFVRGVAGARGVWTGNMNIGVDARAAYHTYRGRDGKLYGEFRDARSGKNVFVSAADAANSVVAFPGQIKAKGDEAYAMVRGKFGKVPKDEVDYEAPSFAHMFSPNTNMNPMPTSVQAGRQFYGSKFWSQYMPLKEGEAPLVDSEAPDGSGKSVSEFYGDRVGALKSPSAGTVVDVTDDAVVIDTADGRKEIGLVKGLPFNRLTSLSYDAVVKPGDTLEAGQPVARSNFTDKASGALSLGRNLKVAVIPFAGWSFEDSIVISEDAAKKLSTSRLFGYDAEERDGIRIGKGRYASLFQNKFTKEQLDKVGDDGVVKPGATLNQGDPIILATGPKLLTAADAALGRLHKALRTSVTDKSQVWEYEHPGVVSDAAFTARGGARVNVKTEPRLEVGDKVSPRFGLKGTIGKIVPQDEMPRDAATNEPYDILLNPMTIQSRVAAGQPIEIALGKLAKAKGRVLLPQIPPDGDDGEPASWADWAAKKLEDAGIPDSADVYDPVLKKTIKNVGDGYMYVLPFHHIAEKKISARGSSGGFTSDAQPSKGGYEGSKRFSSLDVNAILSHGALEVLRDTHLVRGSRNDGYWRAMRSGAPLPEPEVPFVYRKFLATLQAGGVNVTEKGRLTSIRAMTDKDVGALSKGEIGSSDALDKDFRPVPGGLFDPGVTGGADGRNWSHIGLDEPVPNPVMEDPVRRVLGLTVKGLEDVVAGRAELNGKTGGQALRDALAAIDTKAEIARLRGVALKSRGQTRDGAVKALAYLSAADKQGISPAEWMITKVPVLPPMFRPVSRLGKMALSADLNELYRDVIESRNGLRDVRSAAGDAGASDERLQVYEAVRAATGLGDSITPEGRARNLKGAIRQVIGTQPKTGMYQSKVLSKTVGNVGRATATPDPSYDMDEIGIPEREGWEIYKDHVIRRLVRRGQTPEGALEMVGRRDPEARKELLAEAEVRPVIVDRAPTWHKFNLIALRPRFVKGNSIRANPLIEKGMNLDFDGDAMNFHVPSTDKAAAQALEKMLPSKNLISLADLESPMYAPTMEMTMGLYMLTKDPNKKPPVRFATAADAVKAYRAGKIGANDPVDIG